MRLSDLPPYFDGKVKLMTPLTREVRTRCWVWQRSLSYGYAQGYWEGKVVRMHIVTLALDGRVAPAGTESDHLCCRRACIRPAHIEFVTKATNASRVTSRGRNAYALKTHCKQGHEFTPENTRQGKRQRVCLTCHRQRNREYKRRT